MEVRIQSVVVEFILNNTEKLFSSKLNPAIRDGTGGHGGEGPGPLGRGVCVRVCVYTGVVVGFLCVCVYADLCVFLCCCGCVFMLVCMCVCC